MKIHWREDWMDILIRNIEMPKDHGVFIVICSDGIIEQKVGISADGYPIYNIVKGAKATELPPHGEAKDTDIAIKYIKSEMEDDFNETTTLDEKSYKEGMKRAIELIGYAPTILEAST